MSGAGDTPSEALVNPSFEEARDITLGDEIILQEGLGCLHAAVVAINHQTADEISLTLDTGSQTYTYCITADGEDQLTPE